MMAKSKRTGREKGNTMSIMNWIKGSGRNDGQSKQGTRPKAAPQDPGRGIGEFILLPFATLLSTCSLIWTTFSALDLMGVGPIGLTVAISLELIWVGFTVAAHKGTPMWGHVWLTQAIGWAFLVAVIALLAWHGTSLNGDEIFGYYIDTEASRAIAIAGPILPLGAKFMWVLFSAARKARQEVIDNPHGYTEEQISLIDDMERASHFAAIESTKELEAEERAHEIELRKIKMQGDQILAQEMADHKVAIARHKNNQEMRRLSPYAWDEPRVIPGEIERTDQPKQAVLPATSRPARSEVRVHVTELTEAQRKNKLTAAEFYLAKRKNPELTQAAFARSKNISGGQLTRILDRYKEADLAAEAQEEEQAQEG